MLLFLIQQKQNKQTNKQKNKLKLIKSKSINKIDTIIDENCFGPSDGKFSKQFLDKVKESKFLTETRKPG